MKIVMDCPNCGKEISSVKSKEQDWFSCKACSSIFFSNESLRENWPSIYEALMAKRVAATG
jgi:endogenous inhibitor of DNA gyrase (YacG/DUF329 family)